MKCIICKSENIIVTVSKPTHQNTSVRRRRKCLACGYKFTTYEEADKSYLKVIKRDKTLEPFNKTKLLAGITKSFANLDLPLEKQNLIADSIERNIYLSGKEKIKSTFIGEEILKKLRTTNEVAYVRFASVYFKFRSVDEFNKLITTLK
ncbi:MAG: transcriptional regulator NrdR [Patescibacteria group bacterium]